MQENEHFCAHFLAKCLDDLDYLINYVVSTCKYVEGYSSLFHLIDV